MGANLGPKWHFECSGFWSDLAFFRLFLVFLRVVVMSFLALLIALLLEQLRPLAARNVVFAGLRAWSVSVRRSLDEGRWPSAQGEEAAGLNAQSLGGAFVWLAAVLPAVALVAALHAALAWVGWPLALAFDMVVLYAMLGLRQTSGWTHALRQAWAAGDAQQARATLSDWAAALPIAGQPPQALQSDGNDGDEARTHRARALAILGVHQRVLAPLLWFALGAALGAGPAGAVLYRLGQMLAVEWTGPSASVSVASQTATARAWHWLDWLPARATALGFALVGSFEDTMQAWRSEHARRVSNNAFILATASAGMGTQNCPPQHDAMDWAERQLARAHSHAGRIAAAWLLLLGAFTLVRVPGF